MRFSKFKSPRLTLSVSLIVAIFLPHFHNKLFVSFLPVHKSYSQPYSLNGFQHLMVSNHLHPLCIKGFGTISCTCVPPISSEVIIFTEISKGFSWIVNFSNFGLSLSTLHLSPESLWLPAPRSSLDNRLLSETSFEFVKNS